MSPAPSPTLVARVEPDADASPRSASPTDPALPRGRLLATVGPSGSGKSSVIRCLAERGLLRVHPTWTTRPRRGDESHGALEHRFVTDAEFDEAEGRGAFIGVATPFGLPHRYGLPRVEVRDRGPLDTVMLRAPVVHRVRELVGDLVVYAFVASPATTAARLRARGVTSEELARREADNVTERERATEISHRTFDTTGHGRFALTSLEASVAAALELDFGLRR